MATIITHNGSFHADEALAVFLLRLLPKWQSAKLIRTRNPEIINVEATEEAPRIVVDVGGKYDAQRNLFDHHQREFVDTFSSDYPKVRLSSAGLVYKHFGKDIIANLVLKNHKTSFASIVPSIKPATLTVEQLVKLSVMEEIYQKVYKSLILSFDAIDNGVNQFETDLEPIYNDNTGISSRVARLNPRWNDPRAKDAAFEDEQFLKASAICGEEFVSKIEYLLEAWLPAKAITKRSFYSRFANDKKGRVMVLEEFCPWKDHLYDIEVETNTDSDNKVIYCLYEDDRSHQWRIQAVALRSGSFESRLPLPEKWRGVRDADLAAVSGIPDAVFVHATGFIGGCKTKEGAMAMALKALE